MDNNKLSVRLYGKPIGVLEQSQRGQLSFYYVQPFPENTITLSRSLPLSMADKVFTEEECKPFFEGLLPESYAARLAISRKYGISSHNTFKLLQAIGRDCAGAVSFHDIDVPVNTQEYEPLEIDFKEDEEVEALISRLPTDPLLNGIGEVRISLAGFQNKMGIYVDPHNPTTGKIGISKKGSLSTHILKPEIEALPNSAYNEYFCMKLASLIGMDAAKVAFRKIGKFPCLIVERYDRQVAQAGIKRLHQEDFCQALGKLPTQKYQKEEGPSIEDCFKLLDSVSPYLALDRLHLIQYVLFNFIVSNTDAHGKNYSILYDATPLPKLAPLYDVLCCEPYWASHNVTRKMAMKIGEHYQTKDIYSKDWEKLCKSVRLSFPALKKEAKSMSTRILRAMDILFKKEAQLHLSYSSFTQELQKIIQKNINSLMIMFNN